MKSHIVILVFLALMACKEIESSKTNNNSLETGFDSIPMEARPRGLWAWVNGNFDKESITQELKESKEKGMGGFDIWDVNHVQDEDSIVPKGKPFMGDEYTDAIVHTINEATLLGLDIGLVSASGWNSGGAWTQPQHATMQIYSSEIIVSGSNKISHLLPFPLVPLLYQNTKDTSLIARTPNGKPIFYTEIAVLAYPLTADSAINDLTMVKNLSNEMAADGTVNWKAPAGKWKIVRMICANTGQPMIMHTPSSKGPMIDHFNPIATETHIKYILDKLQKGLGTFKGKALKYLYSDSYEVTGQLWTPNMIGEFQKRRGYDITPYLPALNGFTIVNKEITRRFLYDYSQLLSDLIIESHYAKAKQVCATYGVGYVAEAAGPGKPLHNCPFESLKSSGSLSFPRGEFWHKTPGNILQVIKGVASASHIYNQKYVEAESFTSTDLWQESLSELKPTVDRAFCEGLNRIYFHTFPHVPKAAGTPGWIYGFGTQISTHQPWWNMSKPFMNYLGRCSYMLQQGSFVADVLYYYGDAAPNFVPAKHIDPSLGYGYDYDVTNSDILLNKLEVKNGKLTLPHGQQYSVLVLPPLEEMNLKVLVKLEKLIAAGAVVIGQKPTHSTGLKDYKLSDEKVATLAKKIWGNCDGKQITENSYGKGKVYWGKSIRNVLASLGVTPDFHAGKQPTLDSIDFIHRKTNDEEIYFIRNPTKYSKTWACSFREIDKFPQLWDPLTGEKINVDYQKTSSGTNINLELEPEGSVFVVFAKEKRTNISTKRILNPELKATFTDTLKSVWALSFITLQKELIEQNLPALYDLSNSTNKNLKYFTGTMKYEITYKLPKQIEIKNHQAYLDLGQVGVVAKVWLNGNYVGISWKSPFILNISTLKKGSNKIVVEVANLWHNRLIGDAKLTPNLRTTSTNITRLPNGWSMPMKDLPNSTYTLPPSGLIGPVKVYYIKN